MARVKVEEIVDHLRTEFRKALAIAVENVIDDADFNDRELYREFKRAIRRKTRTWENVPDHCIDN